MSALFRHSWQNEPDIKKFYVQIPNLRSPNKVRAAAVRQRSLRIYLLYHILPEIASTMPCAHIRLYMLIAY